MKVPAGLYVLRLNFKREQRVIAVLRHLIFAEYGISIHVCFKDISSERISYR